MQPATNDAIEVNLSALLMLLWLCTKYSQLFRGICANFISGYTIHNLLLFKEYHITGRYSV